MVQASGPTKNSNLKQLLEDLGSASDDARLQLHLLALQTRQRTGELPALRPQTAGETYN